MIRKIRQEDVKDIMEIWLESNLQMHSFIPEEYWRENYNYVKEAIMEAEVMVYEEKEEILAFIGIVSGYIAGIFVKEGYRSREIGKVLMDYGKGLYDSLDLDVFLNNELAVKFYLREGFRIVDRKKNEDTGFEEYRMEWRK